MTSFVVQKEFSSMHDWALLYDPRTHQPHRNEKTAVILQASKGCVARCTFCHRWDKGIRYIPVAIVMERVDYLIQN